MYRATGNTDGSSVVDVAMVEKILQRPAGPNSEIEFVYRVLGEELAQTSCYGAHHIVAVESRIAKLAASKGQKVETQREVSGKQATRGKRNSNGRPWPAQMEFNYSAPRP